MENAQETCQVSVHLCKRCKDPTSSSDQPEGLPTGFAKYLLTTTPIEVLCVGPGTVGYGSDAAIVAANCLLILREGQPVRVSVHLCKRCRDPTSSSDQPEGLPTGFAKYLLTTTPIGDAPPTSLDDNEATWESDRHGVEAVVDHRLVTQARGRASQLQYRVRWEGDSLADTWEPAHYLDSCPEALREYWHQLAVSSKSGAVVKGASTQVVRARMRQALQLLHPERRLATAGKQQYRLPPDTIALEQCPDPTVLRRQCTAGVRVLQVWCFGRNTEQHYEKWCEGVIKQSALSSPTPSRCCSLMRTRRTQLT
jgi:hypothetical protein